MTTPKDHEDLVAATATELHDLRVTGVKAKPSHSMTFLLSDQQAGYHDKTLHKLVLAAIKVMQPQDIVLPGDLIDFPAVGSYSDGGFRESMQESIDAGRGVVEDYRNALGYGKSIRYIPGNHEHRLTKYLLKNAPALYHVIGAGQKYPSMSVPGLLGLEELQVEWMGGLDPNEYPLAHTKVAQGLMCYHGWIARKHGGMSALASLENQGTSIIVGHTHRLAHLIKTVHSDGQLKFLHAVEAGTMCKVAGGLDWTVDPNWQNGFVIVHHTAFGGWSIQLVHWEGWGELIVPPYVFQIAGDEVVWNLL